MPISSTGWIMKQEKLLWTFVCHQQIIKWLLHSYIFRSENNKILYNEKLYIPHFMITLINNGLASQHRHIKNVFENCSAPVQCDHKMQHGIKQFSTVIYKAAVQHIQTLFHRFHFHYQQKYAMHFLIKILSLCTYRSQSHNLCLNFSVAQVVRRNCHFTCKWGIYHGTM